VGKTWKEGARVSQKAAGKGTSDKCVWPGEKGSSGGGEPRGELVKEAAPVKSPFPLDIRKQGKGTALSPVRERDYRK